ncbi:MAG: hypothetical protein A2Y56_13345 [Candidatus Aminicenantes bacterium RBG_13_63_10]|nr:MAG: hypothetical protein A2Y56_13345 [Candidatus Aminicenantes bacterium RBG_13_63_10]
MESLRTSKPVFGRALLTAALAALILLPAPGCRGPREKRGIVLIVLDSLRRDHLSHFGYGRPTSPFLDDLMSRGVLFRNAYSTASQTVPSVSSMLTGLYPYRHGSHFFRSGQSYHPTRPVEAGGLPMMKESNLLLAEVFKKHGFRTAAVSANPGIRDIYGFAQGVELFRYIDCFAESSQGVCDGATVNALFKKDVLPEIRGHDFFVYLHYMDVHYPYYKPNSFRGRFREYQGEPFYVNGPAPPLTAEELEYSKACYDEGIVYLDSVIKNLFDILEREGLLASTLVAVVSDHGDEFLEHGGLGHGTTCYNELIHSFLLLSHPRLAARRVEAPVSLADVFPALLEWAGIETPEGGDGASLHGYFTGPESAGDGGGRVFFAELGDRKAVIDGPLKFIADFDLKTEELYNLEVDPGENDNLAPLRPEETARYKAKLITLFRRMALSYSETPLSEQERQNLRSLGYIR